MQTDVNVFQTITNHDTLVPVQNNHGSDMDEWVYILEDAKQIVNSRIILQWKENRKVSMLPGNEWTRKNSAQAYLVYST